MRKEALLFVASVLISFTLLSAMSVTGLFMFGFAWLFLEEDVK